MEFEWIGIPRSLEGGVTRGAQNTSVDAFLVAETTAGRRRAYLLEWKYLEQYQSTRPDFKGEGKSGDTRRLRYAEPFRAPALHNEFSLIPIHCAEFVLIKGW